MRLTHLVACVAMLIAALSAAAQDIIVRPDGSEIKAKVEKITPENIEYHKADNPGGPLYTIPVADVTLIRFQNGQVERFGAASDTATQPASELPADPQGYQGYMQQTARNDAELLAQYENLKGNTPLRKEANKWKLAGYIGGAVLVVGGATLLALGLDDNIVEYNSGVTAGSVLIGAGVAGGIICNVIAYNKMKKAKRLETYGTTLFDTEILRSGKNSLNLGFNIMGERATGTQAFGPSLTYNF